MTAAIMMMTFMGGCEDPEGACEEATARLPHCNQGKKSTCDDEGETFHEGDTCQRLGYTREEGTTWFRPADVP